VGTEKFHVEGETDMRKLTVAFRNFANALKIAVYSENVNAVVLKTVSPRPRGNFSDTLCPVQANLICSGRSPE
jgi:hypothetical protein